MIMLIKLKLFMTSFIRKKKKPLHHSKDPVYMGLLRLLSQYDNQVATFDAQEACSIIEQVRSYSKIHWRLIPQLLDFVIRNRLDGSIDSEVLEFLRVQTKLGIVKELAKETQLSDLVSILIDKKIRVILLKGAANSAYLYSSDAPRLSNDIDFLVCEEDWHLVHELLSKSMLLADSNQQGIFSNLYETTFVPKRLQSGYSLDLHVSLVHPFLYKIDYKELWSQSIQCERFGNDYIRVLSHEDALIHNAIHAAKDLNFFSYGLLDSLKVYQIAKIDPRKFLDKIERWQVYSAFMHFNRSFECAFGFPLITFTSVKHSFLFNLRSNLVNRLLSTVYVDSVKKKNTYRFRIRQVLVMAFLSDNLIGPSKLVLLYLKRSILRKFGINF